MTGHDRVFIGLTEVSGYFSSLDMGMKQLGVKSVFVSPLEHPFLYSSDGSRSAVVLLVKKAGRRWRETRKSAMPVRLFYSSCFKAAHVLLFTWAALSYDTFIFSSNGSFFDHKELPLLKALGKKVIFVYLGSDSRPPYVDGSIMNVSRGTTIDDCIQRAAITKSRLLNVEKYADVIVNYPPQAYFHERPFVSGMILGIPFSVEGDGAGLHGREGDGVVRILHSPSSPEARGTDRIRLAIERMKKKGHAIEFIEVTGKPHSVVLEELQRCDFVIDSMYADTAMARFSTEAAWFGKPSLMSGYYAAQVKEDVSPEHIPPSLFCHPDDFDRELERMIVDRDMREALGDKAKRFVREEWCPRKVAERYARLMSGDIPDGWLFDPRTIRYPYGGGLSRERVREIVRAVIGRGGKQALMLSDKPELEEIFVRLAGGDEALD